MEAIPDHIIESIFFRLDSTVSLIRAASTCKRWRRIIADPGFLRLFRSVRRGQPSAVVGMYYNKTPGRRPDFVASAWVNDVVIDGRFFSLDFLPNSGMTPWVWSILDSRGSLLLFARICDPKGRSTWFEDGVVICEPLTRRYVRVDPCSRFAGYSISNAYLVDGEPGGIGMASFQVVFDLHVRGTHCHAGLFTVGSSGSSPLQESSCWRTISIDALMADAGPSDELTPTSVCWYDRGRRVVALDRSTAKFSSVLLPQVEGWNFHNENYHMRVTAGHDGTARVLVLHRGAGGHLRVFARLQQGSGEWALVRSVWPSDVTRDLPGYDPSFFTDALLIPTDASTPVVLLSPRQRTKWWFHLDVDTMEVAPAPDPDYAMVYPTELPWPPTLHACY